MTTFTEVLPTTRTMKRGAIHWTPTDDTTPATIAGVVRIDTDRASCTYQLREFPNDWNGRSFLFVKLPGETGTDAENEQYEVFCGTGGPGSATCSCRGFDRWRVCKHVLTAKSLLDNRWV